MSLLRDVQETSRREDGCLSYGYYREIADEGAHVAVEEWRDMEALEDHLRTEHVARLIAALPEHVAEPPSIQAHVVTETVPLPLP